MQALRILFPLIASAILVANLVWANGTSGGGGGELNQVAQAAQLDKLADSDWKPAHYELYDSSELAEPKTPESTLELLIKLDKVYKPFTDEQTNGRKSRIAELIWASRRSRQHCSKQSLDTFKHLLGYTDIYPQTLQVYLKYHLRDFLNQCRANVIDNLHNNVKNMSEAHRVDIVLLEEILNEVKRESAAQDRGDFFRRKHFVGDLTQGLLNFLLQKMAANNLDPRELVMDKNSRANFIEFYKEHVLDMCQEWIVASETAQAFAMSDAQLSKTIKSQEDANNYLAYGDLCQHIVKHHDYLGNQLLYPELKRQSFKHPGIAKTMHRLTNLIK